MSSKNIEMMELRGPLNHFQDKYCCNNNTEIMIKVTHIECQPGVSTMQKDIVQ